MTRNITFTADEALIDEARYIDTGGRKFTREEMNERR